MEAEEIIVGEKATKVLEQIVRQPNNPQWLVTRSRVILRAGAGESNSQIAREMGMTRIPVRKWRGRWSANEDRLAGLEEAEDKALREAIESILADEARPGTPPKFSAEQIVQIVAVSCEQPETCEHPISHWTPEELAEEVIKRGIVESISPRSVGRFLK